MPPFTNPTRAETGPVRRETLAPGDFLRLHRDDRGNIASVRIVPPALGSPGFGGLEVEYKRPIYRHRLPG